MQKLLIGVLALLALYFAASNARLTERLRALESRPAAVDGRERSRPVAPKPAPVVDAAPAAAPERVTPPLTLEKASLVPAPASETFLNKAQLVVSDAIDNVDNFLSKAVQTKWLVMNRTAVELDLGLSEWQKRAIEDLKKSRDLQTQVYKDQIKTIDGQTDLAIRQLLNAEQLQKYDAQPSVKGFETQMTFQPQEDAAPAGQSAGYLGVSASSASGGGAQIDEVMPDSAASTFGLQAGDVVLEYNGGKISDFTGFSAKIRGSVVGAPVVLKIRRGGTEFYQNVVMGARK